MISALNCSNILDLHLFADDSNLFFYHENLSQLELIVNDELTRVHTWLCANKLSLNIVKSSFVLFHRSQRKIEVSHGDLGLVSSLLLNGYSVLGPKMMLSVVIALHSDFVYTHQE